MVNTDGVEYTSSTSKSLYPVFLCVNELPPHLRSKLIITPFLFTKTKGEKFDEKLMSLLVLHLNEMNVNGVSVLF